MDPLQTTSLFAISLLLMVLVLGLLTVPILENFNEFQNPFHRPVVIIVFFIGTVVALWFDIGAALPIDKFLTVDLF